MCCFNYNYVRSVQTASDPPVILPRPRPSCIFVAPNSRASYTVIVMGDCAYHSVKGIPFFNSQCTLLIYYYLIMYLFSMRHAHLLAGKAYLIA